MKLEHIVITLTEQSVRAQYSTQMDTILNEQQSINSTMSQITNEIHRENGSNVNIEHVQMLNNGNHGIKLEPCDPIDLQFKDVTYSVNLGFRKGKYFSRSRICVCVLVLLFDDFVPFWFGIVAHMYISASASIADMLCQSLM